jgi:uncharacterized protein (TIGR03437 family)
MQINFRLPDTLPVVNTFPVQLEVAGAISRTVSIAVAP